MKKKIEEWLYSIIKHHYNEKESEIYIKTYIEDEIGFTYLKNQYEKNKKQFKTELNNNIKKTKKIEEKKQINIDTNRYNLRTNIN